MKQRFKKLILAMMLAISLPSFAHDFEVDGVYYNILSSTDKTVEVTYRGRHYYSNKEYSGKVIIPSTVTNYGTTYSITSIREYAFSECSGLTSVTIGNSVTEIGDCAFSGCSGLTSATIPNSVTEIGHLTFRSCSGLTSVTIPNSVTKIGDSAFSGCSGLKSVTIPNSVSKIGEMAFFGCKNLNEVINLSKLSLSKGSKDHGYVAYYATIIINK